MFDDTQRTRLATEIAAQIAADRALLDELVTDLQTHGLKRAVRQIRTYSTSAMAIVSSDGGNHAIRFDPFHHQLIRVVDSDGQTLALEAIALTTDLDRLFAKDTQPQADGTLSSVGVLVRDLGRATGAPIDGYRQLCPAINLDPQRPEQTTGWVQAYRDLWEWAVLYKRLMYADFAQSTLVVRDGLLRTKLFGRLYFRVMGDLLAARFKELRERARKSVMLVGFAKHSSVIDLYRLALELEDVLPAGCGYWVQVPREIEQRAYKFAEFARGRERLVRNRDGLCAACDPATGRLVLNGPKPGIEAAAEDSKFVFGTMLLVRFGANKADPIWAVDVFDDQIQDADTIIGHLAADAKDGFPVPFYPASLQRAHEEAKLTDLDADLLNAAVLEAIRAIVGSGNATVIDRLEIGGDITGRRY